MAPQLNVRETRLARAASPAKNRSTRVGTLLAASRDESRDQCRGWHSQPCRVRRCATAPRPRWAGLFSGQRRTSYRAPMPSKRPYSTKCRPFGPVAPDGCSHPKPPLPGNGVRSTTIRRDRDRAVKAHEDLGHNAAFQSGRSWNTTPRRRSAAPAGVIAQHGPKEAGLGPCTRAPGPALGSSSHQHKAGCGPAAGSLPCDQPPARSAHRPDGLAHQATP
jgi:hypothetical protein